MAGDTLTIAIAALAFIAGTIGAWLTWVQLRDEQRRLEKRARLGLGTYGDVIAVPDEARHAPGSPIRAGGELYAAPRRNATHRSAQ